MSNGDQSDGQESSTEGFLRSGGRNRGKLSSANLADSTPHITSAASPPSNRPPQRLQLEILAARSVLALGTSAGNGMTHEMMSPHDVEVGLFSRKQKESRQHFKFKHNWRDRAWCTVPGGVVGDPTTALAKGPILALSGRSVRHVRVGHNGGPLTAVRL